MPKNKKVYNKQYKDIKKVEVKIMQTDSNHTNLKDANFMLDVRIPVRNKKIILNDVVNMIDNLSIVVANGFAEQVKFNRKVQDFMDDQQKLNKQFIGYMDRHP